MSILGLLVGVLVGALLSGLIIWVVGKLNLGLEVDGFGPAYIAAIVIAVLNMIITWLLNAMNLAIAGGFFGAIIHLLIYALFSRSKIPAAPMPPPMHIDTMP